MPDLVGQHVGLGEVARRPEALIEFLVEAEIDVDAVVAGAIEGSRRGFGKATKRACSDRVPACSGST